MTCERKEHRVLLLAPHESCLLPCIGGTLEPAAVPCQKYSWEDRGSTVRVSVSLPSSLPAATATAHIACKFSDKSLQLSIQNTTKDVGPLVLQVQNLFAAILPEGCSWRLDNGGQFPVGAVDEDGGTSAGALVVAGTKPWVVCLTLRKADPELCWHQLSAVNLPPEK